MPFFKLSFRGDILLSSVHKIYRQPSLRKQENIEHLVTNLCSFLGLLQGVHFLRLWRRT